MSKFFFKGRIDKREDYGNYDYKSTRDIKFGTESSPLSLTVTTEEREAEIQNILHEHSLFANIEVDAEAEEDITQLTVLLNKPDTVVLQKRPGRNDPCSCGSGKKYKKCCISESLN